MNARNAIKADLRLEKESIRYSICTLVTRHLEYAAMVESFERRGFDGSDCEFLYLDNSDENFFDAYSGNNLFLNAAKGRFVILCHQDVALLEDGRVTLDHIIEHLSRIDPYWGVCGNSGRDEAGRLAICISDPHGRDQRIGDFPVRVRSLDENFLIVRRAANLAFSNDLTGFHLYGTDICLIAETLGSHCYVIDFHLRHNSAGTMNHSFFKARDRMVRKYALAFRSRWILTTCTILFISGILVLSRLFNTNTAVSCWDRITQILFRRSEKQAIQDRNRSFERL
jgi:hypothetical protein